MRARVLRTGYGAEALARLREVVAEAKQSDPMAPVTVVVPQHLAGIVARRHLARGVTDGRPAIAGLTVTTLPRLAEQLSAARFHPRRPATSSIVAAAWRSAVDAEPGGLAPVARHPATIRALVRAHTELRELDAESLETVRRHSDLGADLVRLHQQVGATLAAAWYDETDLLRAAAPDPRLGTVVLYLPGRLTWSERAFAGRLTALESTTVVLGTTGDDDADAAVHLPFPGPGAAIPEPVATTVLHASDADDEVRCVVRRVVATLAHVPAHRVAVLHAEGPYPRLLHEHLAAADIAANGPGVRAVRDRALARGFLAVLDLPQGDFRRSDLFGALSQAPVRTEEGRPLPVSRWERLSRSAGVVSGTDWQQRIDRYVEDQQAIIDQEQAADEPQQWRADRATAAQEDGRALQTFVVGLREALATGAGLTTWGDLSTWAGDLFTTLYGSEDDLARLPREEKYAAVAIRQAVAGLAGLHDLQPRADLTMLIDVLGLELEKARPRVGRFGEGVLVAPVSAAPGLDLDAVFLVGMAEDAYPGRMAQDPLLPEALRAALQTVPRLRDRVHDQQRAFLAALASAPDVTASFPRGDLRRSTPRLPSRWLVPTLRALTGDDDLMATTWAGSTAAEPDAIVSSDSFWDETRKTPTPSGDHEWRLRATAGPAPDLDDVATNAVHLIEQRRADRFTRFDGNLSDDVAGLPDLAAPGSRTVSPTELESYAICPHTWFVSRLLGVRPIEQPEEIVSISPADIGLLVHDCLDTLVQECGDDLPGFGAPWSSAQRELLRGITERKAAEFEARGVTGHRLLWQRERQLLIRDLQAMLDADDEYRALRRARVLGSELRFGSRGMDPVVLAVPQGEIRMSGSADKVDQTEDGTLLVTDIKTGSASKFDGIKPDNPLADATKLQLPVYALAARARFGDQPAEAMYWFARGKDRGNRKDVSLSEEVQDRYSRTVGTLVASIAAGLYPAKAPDDPDFLWVQCAYCNPDGLGHGDARARYETKRHDDVLNDLVSLIDPTAVQP